MNYKIDFALKFLFIYPLLILSLAPISIASSNGEGISANYLFIFIIPLLAGFKFKVNGEALLFIFAFSICFFLSLPVNYIYAGLSFDHFVRQLSSLLIFLSPFILLFVNLKKIEFIFLKSIIIISVIYSIFAIIFFYLHITSSGMNPYVIKDALNERVPDWPQRYVLVLFAGFFLSFDVRLKSSINYFVKFVILFAITITFLRAAFLALLVGLAAYWLHGLTAKNYKFNRTVWIYSVIFLVLFFVIINDWIIYSDFFESYSMIINYFFDSAGSLLSGAGAENISDQTRLDILTDGLSRINPIFGLGGGGIYFVIPEIGSSHNQFFDYYVRFGIIGLFAFIYFNIRIIRYFKKSNPWVIGLIFSYIVFGIAHETTKYSYGALIFFFLLSLTYNSKNENVIQASGVVSRVPLSLEDRN